MLPAFHQASEKEGGISLWQCFSLKKQQPVSLIEQIPAGCITVLKSWYKYLLREPADRAEVQTDILV